MSITRSEGKIVVFKREEGWIVGKVERGMIHVLFETNYFINAFRSAFNVVEGRMDEFGYTIPSNRRYYEKRTEHNSFG